jgi:hypothetical protein
MKDITIKAKTIKRELWILLVSILIAFGLNIYAIINYETEWSELFGKFQVVILMGIIIYVILIFFRSFFKLLRKFAGK